MPPGWDVPNAANLPKDELRPCMQGAGGLSRNNGFNEELRSMSHGLDVHMNTLVPMVVETTNRGERAYDIYSRLAKGTDHLL